MHGAEWLFPVWAYASGPIRLLPPLLVTVHVLLRKRDVSASVGWIGLAWLAPLMGSAAYYLLGVNRVRQKARQVRGTRRMPLRPAPPPHDEAGHLAPLERTIGVITRRPARRGSTIAMLHDGDGAYPAMLAAIGQARHSVGLSSYILRDDVAGGPFLDALIAAHARGVAVRVLVDGIGGGYFRSPAWRRLRHHGVPAARFMHSGLPWRMPFLNLRNHKKVLLVDGRIGFTGGLNIGAEDLLASRPKHPVRDTHFRLDGLVVAQLAEAFVHDWKFTTGEVLDGPAWQPEPVPAGDAVARVITSGPDEDLEKIEMIALQAIACARDSIRVLTPYFLPAEPLIIALSLAAMRGVAVDIVIPDRSNHRLIDWATRAHVGPLLAAGCRIWRGPPPFDHSKLMVVDDAWCLVGSSNWDTRSLRLNFELNLEVYHADLARRAAAQIDARRGAALTEDDLARRALPARLRDAAVRLAMPYL